MHILLLFILALLGNLVAADAPNRKKIVFGICGIGSGHCYRELPVVTHFFEQGHDLLLFAYADAISFYKQRFPDLNVIEVANPFFVGGKDGIEFEQTALLEKNRIDYHYINMMAMHKAKKLFGTPDLVISDYEMVSAQYAYVHGTPLVTLDQQSKYLAGTFDDLNGLTAHEEIQRVRLMFPQATKRIAVSFFNVENAESSHVDILGPMLRPEIIAAKDIQLSDRPSVVVYVSALQLGEKPINEWIATIKNSLPDDFEAYFSLPRQYTLPESSTSVHFYHHGDKRYEECFIKAHAIISTAGHTLLSEAMFLEKPVYAIPLPIYEQQLNADVIDRGGFGMKVVAITEETLRTFFAKLDDYRTAIRTDTALLLKEPGNGHVINELELLLSLKPQPN